MRLLPIRPVHVGRDAAHRHANAERCQQRRGRVRQCLPLDAFIRIDRQGAVTLAISMVEIGQGTYISLAMLAEELEVELDRVRLEHASPNDALCTNSLLHVQTTGLSASVRAPLR